MGIGDGGVAIGAGCCAEPYEATLQHEMEMVIRAGVNTGIYHWARVESGRNHKLLGESAGSHRGYHGLWSKIKISDEYRRYG